MNETEIQLVLKSIYDACQRIEVLIDKMKDANEYFDIEEQIEFFQEIYDEIFDLTTTIEMYYGLI